MSAVFKDPNVEWNAEALRLSGMLALQGRNASGNRGLLKARLEPSAGLKEHITFQSNSVQLSSYRLQIEVDSQRRLWEGFRAGRIPATNVKRISSTNSIADWTQHMSQVAAWFERVEALQRALYINT